MKSLRFYNDFKKAGIILWVVPVAFLMGCANDTAEVMLPELNTLQPIQLNHNADITYSSYGLVTTRIQAPLIARYQVEDSSWFELYKTFKVNFYDSLGQPESELNADSGLWNEKEQYMHAWSNVSFLNKDSQLLETSELMWLQDSAIIYTEKNVKITRPDGIIYGKGLVANEDFSKWKIKKITGELIVNEKSDSTLNE